jgi:hypothetical protein
LTDIHIESPVKNNNESITSVYNGQERVPAIISFMAKDTFKIGIHAVEASRVIPGIMPIIMGIIMSIFNGPIIL